MGHDHQLAGIKLLWLAGLNIGWRMTLSQCIQCIQCVQIGLKPFQNIYIYVYIYAKAVKVTWERIKAYRVHIYLYCVEQLGNNQWLKILISELEYVDLWITCVLIHCFTGGSHSPGWVGHDMHPSLPGSRMPVLRILTVDEKFGLGYSDARNIEHIEIKEHLIKIAPKLIIYHLSCTISIASNGRIPGFFTALIVKRVWLIGTLEYVVWECQAISCQSDRLPDCVNGCVYFVD